MEYPKIMEMDRHVYEDMVNPILIYADLIATGDQRNIETAKVIYDQYLIRYFRED